MNERFDVIGCAISRVKMADAIAATVARIRNGDGGYVCFTNVHASVMARGDSTYRDVLNKSFLTLPDGKPVYWVGRLWGITNIEQIPGPDFLPSMLAYKNEPPLRHYFFGGRIEVLKRLVANLEARFPHAAIVGFESPPFRELTPEERKGVIQRIRASGADIVWVGLGAPKQEHWMAAHSRELKPAVLMGVGAAFDFHAGNISRAPVWMRKAGLEWLHRLLREPGRLWKRYLITNTLFLLYVCKDLIIRK